MKVLSTVNITSAILALLRLFAVRQHVFYPRIKSQRCSSCTLHYWCHFPRNDLHFRLWNRILIPIPSNNKNQNISLVFKKTKTKLTFEV